jgi:hypothetical protein
MGQHPRTRGARLTSHPTVTVTVTSARLYATAFREGGRLVTSLDVAVKDRPKRYGVLAEIELARSRADCSSHRNGAKVPSCPQGRHCRREQPAYVDGCVSISRGVTQGRLALCRPMLRHQATRPAGSVVLALACGAGRRVARCRRCSWQKQERVPVRRFRWPSCPIPVRRGTVVAGRPGRA